MSREIKLPSGMTLVVQPAPFKDAKALYQALLAEFRSLPVSADMDMVRLFKDLFCTGFASPLIETCVLKCMERCTYAGVRLASEAVVSETFDPVERRQDYMLACKEVAQDNVSPFMKSLSADFSKYLSMNASIQESLQKMTRSQSSSVSAKADTSVQ